MAQFILEVPRYKQADAQPKVRVSQEAYAVLSQMCAKTAIPMSQVASKAILFAAQYLQVKEIGEEEDKE